MFVSQIKSGDTYDQLKRYITINIVDFECTPLKQLHSCYHLIEDHTGHKLTDMVKAMLLRGMTIEEVASIANMDISKVTEIKHNQR